MAAYDNVSLPAPPNIAGAGNYAQMLMQATQGLYDAYAKGQENQYKQRQNNLFQNGVPTDANGNVDFAATLKSLMQSGGAPTAGQVLPMLQKQPFLDAVLKEYQGDNGQGGQPAANVGPANSSAPAGPASSQPPASAGSQPALSATGSDSTGSETVRSLTAGMANGRDVPRSVMANLGKAIGAGDIDAPLTADQEARLRLIGGTYFQGSGGAQPAPSTTMASGGQPAAAPGAAPAAPAAPGVGAPTNFNDRFSAAGGTAGAPATGRPPPLQVTVGRKPMEAGPQAAQPAVGGAAGMVPPGTDPRSYAEALKKRADFLRRQGDIRGFIGAPSKSKEDQAAALDKQADQILEQLGKAGELTPTQKDVASGATQREAQIKDDTTRYGKQLAAIQGSAQAANRQLEHIQLAEALYKDPNFYSGSGENINLGYKRVLNAVGIDPGASLPQEAFRKTMAAAVLNQVEQLKDDTAAVGGGGRIFQAQIELMEKAANNPDNSVNANRLLTEISKRSAMEAKTIAQMANNYNGGHLDAKFAQMVDDHYTKHPMFTPNEMRDIRMIAPPVAPRLDSQEQATAWARKAGLKPGDPMKLPSGRIVPAP